MEPPLQPPTPPPTPPSAHLGRVLLIHLGLTLVLHLGRQMIDDDAGIFIILFLLAAFDLAAFVAMLISGQWRLGLSFLLSALLMFIIGFGDCATHLHLGSMR